MAKRIGFTFVLGAALFGLASTGMLARHRMLRSLAFEAVKFDVDVLTGR